MWTGQGTTLNVAHRAPLCLSSCVGKFSAPILKLAVKILARKLAVNYSPGNNRNVSVPCKHLGKLVHALVTGSSLLLLMVGFVVSSMWGLIYHKVLCEINVPDLAHRFI